MDRRMTFLSAGVAALSLATVVIAKKPEKPGGKPGGDSQHVIQVVIDGHGISSCTNINLGCVVEIGLRDRPTTRLRLHPDIEDRLIAMALELGG